MHYSEIQYDFSSGEDFSKFGKVRKCHGKQVKCFFSVQQITHSYTQW